jgi:hypothetical protein
MDRFVPRDDSANVMDRFVSRDDRVTVMDRFVSRDDRFFAVDCFVLRGDRVSVMARSAATWPSIHALAGQMQRYAGSDKLY